MDPPCASGYHTHNVGGFKALASLCLRLTPNLDELHIVHGKQKGDTVWLKAFKLLGTEFK